MAASQVVALRGPGGLAFNRLPAGCDLAFSLTGLSGWAPSSPPLSSATSATCPGSAAGTTSSPAPGPRRSRYPPDRARACRLSRRGNRRLSHAIYMAAVTQVRRRHSEGRGCYGKKLAGGKTPKGGPALAEAAGQQRHVRLPAGRCPAGRSPRGRPGRAAGDRLCRQRGRLAPQAPALRTGHSRALPRPYDRGRQPGTWSCQCPGQRRPFPGGRHPAAGDAAGPGRTPAAKRGPATSRCGKTTAPPGREEGQGPRIAGKAAAPGGHLISLEQDRRNPP